MSEVWVRAILIGSVFALAGAILIGARYRSRLTPRKIEATGLEEGMYLMTSSACPDCATARDRLETALGEKGYTEMSWERDPEVFESLDIDGVPAVLIVGSDGSGEVWSGQPDRALRTLSSGHLE